MRVVQELGVRLAREGAAHELPARAHAPQGGGQGAVGDLALLEAPLQALQAPGPRPPQPRKACPGARCWRCKREGAAEDALYALNLVARPQERPQGAHGCDTRARPQLASKRSLDAARAWARLRTRVATATQLPAWHSNKGSTGNCQAHGTAQGSRPPHARDLLDTRARVQRRGRHCLRG